MHHAEFYSRFQEDQRLQIRKVTERFKEKGFQVFVMVDDNVGRLPLDLIVAPGEVVGSMGEFDMLRMCGFGPTPGIDLQLKFSSSSFRNPVDESKVVRAVYADSAARYNFSGKYLRL